MSEDTAIQVLESAAYDRFLSAIGKRLQPNPIQSILHLEHSPGLISFLAGMPNPFGFPITSLSFTTRHPSGADVELKLAEKDLETALQYNQTSGVPEFVQWITGLQEYSHNRRSSEEGWKVSIGVGSQDLIQKCLNGIFDPGDPILIETPAYPGLVPLFRTMDLELIEIGTDKHGIDAASLRSVLEKWPKGKPIPKALYTVPVGSNPTGYTATHERRIEVLQLARQYDFLILEDDPYYYLYYGTNPRPPSYFSLEARDTSVAAGRIIRFDTLSKVLSSGLRLGFVTAPNRIVDMIDMQTGVRNLHASSLSQIVALSIFKLWGYEGFIAHTLRVSEFYKTKRDICAAAFNKYLKEYAEWEIPEAGMFFWFKLKIPPDANGECDSEKLIRESAMKAGVLALPGVVAFPLKRKNAYCRASFSLLSEQDIDEACRRLASVVAEAYAA